MKSIDESQVISKFIVMPQHTNPNGLMFGGVLLGWMDMAAAMVAGKHSEKDVVTVHIDQVTFTSPIRVGEHVIINASLIGTGKSSMKIKVTVDSENVKEGIRTKTTEATLTFVAVDEMMKASPVPSIQQNQDPPES